MRNLFRSIKRRLVPERSQLGMTLVEILVALAILGIVAPVFLAGAATGLKAVMISQERVAAESIAKSAMEFVKAESYDKVTVPSYTITGLLLPVGYSVPAATVRYLDPKGDGNSNDDGLKEITIIVMKGDKELLSMTTYKVKPKVN